MAFKPIKLYLGIVALLVVLGLVLCLLFYSGPFYAYDDLKYMELAHSMLIGTFNMGQNPRAYSILLIAVLALSFKVFGYGMLQVELPSVIEYLAMSILAFQIGRKLYGNMEGALAMFFVLTAPFIVEYITRAMPDMLIGMLTGLSLYALVAATSLPKAKAGLKKVLFFFSGVFATLTVYVKLEGLLFVLFFAVAILILSMFRGRKAKHSALLSISFSEFSYAMLGIVLAFYAYIMLSYFYTGSATLTFSSYGAWQHSLSPVNLSDNMNNLYITLFGYLYTGTSSFVHAYVISPIIYPYGFVIFFIIMGTLLSIGNKDRSAAFLSLLSWPIFFYFFFGTMELSKYTFIAVITRYFSIIAIPMAIVGAYGFSRLHKMLEQRIGKKAYIFSIIFMTEIFLFSIPTYITIYDYNSAIVADNHVLSSVASAIATNSSIMSNNEGAAEYVSIISGRNYKVVNSNSCSTYMLYFYNASNTTASTGNSSPAESACNALLIKNIKPESMSNTFGVPLIGCRIYKASK
ncbi:MAG: ArnT family glycosyltransferase [Candidatus Micrarchaeia archaeon]